MKAAVKIWLVALALGAAACARAPQGPTTVIVVRHAEKASDAEDSPLTDAGAKAAQALARVAEGASVAAVYSSQFRRNLDTARPLAERAGVPVTQAPVDLRNPGDYGPRLAGEILRRHAGQTVVVVGHANTVGATVDALAGRQHQLGDVQYGDLFVVILPAAGPARVLRAQFGR